MKEKSAISRREFLLLSAGVGAAVACPAIFSGCVEEFCDDLNPAVGYKPGVTSGWVKKGELENSYALFKSVVEGATDFSWLTPGDSVFISLTMDSGNAFPAVSDPMSLRFLARLLKEKGAGTIRAGGKSRIEEVLHSHRGGQPMHWLLTALHDLLGQDDVAWGSTRELAASSGLLSAMEAEGVEPIFFEERGHEGFTRAAGPAGGEWTSPLYVSTALLESDHIVQLTRVSRHKVAGVACGLQMASGFLRDDSAFAMLAEAPMYHRRCEAINHIDGFQSRHRLVVTTATELMVTDGPDKGVVVVPDDGMICASEDILANELLATAWLSAHGEQDKEDIYCLPMIRSHMERNGRPEALRWHQVNSLPLSSKLSYLNALLKTS